MPPTDTTLRLADLNPRDTSRAAVRLVLSLAAAMRDGNREGSETALARFFAETNR